MERKKPNNKVKFSAYGKEVVFRLTDLELKKLRAYSNYLNGEDWEKFNFGQIRNFSVFALFDYVIKGSKAGRFHANFNYHKFETMYWTLM